MEYMTSWEEQGRERGMQQHARYAIRRFIEIRLGVLEEDEIKLLDRLDQSHLDSLIDEILALKVTNYEQLKSKLEILKLKDKN